MGELNLKRFHNFSSLLWLFNFFKPPHLFCRSHRAKSQTIRSIIFRHFASTVMEIKTETGLEETNTSIDRQIEEINERVGSEKSKNNVK